MTRIQTEFTKLMNCALPIIGAPMFLVSNAEMVVAVSEAGGVGAFPALNYRPIDEYKKVLKEIRQRTQKPIAVNIIVNKSNSRQIEDLKWGLEAGVNLFITSLGNPKEVIREAHKIGSKVVCDVTNLDHAKKVQDLGADGVIAVGAGAGGHAGPISPTVLIPWLKKELEIPIIAAGNIVDGRSMFSTLALGASAVSVGTRFIASKEASVTEAYKEAILKATPEDVVLTTKISGTPANVIKTPYIEKVGTDLPWIVDRLQKNPYTKDYAKLAIHWLGMRSLETAAEKPTWKTVWSAGQGAGLIDEVLTCKEIMQSLVDGYIETQGGMPHVEKS
jgi:nitronate monooxygenase